MVRVRAMVRVRVRAMVRVRAGRQRKGRLLAFGPPIGGCAVVLGRLPSLGAAYPSYPYPPSYPDPDPYYSHPYYSHPYYSHPYYSHPYYSRQVQTSLGAEWQYEHHLEPGAPPVQLTGEMVFSWMGEDFAWLRSIPPAAELLALALRAL